MERIRDGAKPLVGGLYSGVYNLGQGYSAVYTATSPQGLYALGPGYYQKPVVHYPEWRQQDDGMYVGWLDPKTDPYSPDPIPSGKP